MSPDSASLTPDVRIEALLNALLASDVRNLRVLVAVSGGPDSTALLIALQEAGHDVVAAHYDHALREGSDAVGGNVAALCERLGLRLITERRSEPLAKGSHACVRDCKSFRRSNATGLGLQDVSMRRPLQWPGCKGSLSTPRRFRSTEIECARCRSPRRWKP